LGKGTARAPKEFWQLRNSLVEVGEKLSPQQFHDIVRDDGNWIIAAEFSVRVDIDFHVVDGVSNGQEPLGAGASQRARPASELVH
jgi:hypothetical protein